VYATVRRYEGIGKVSSEEVMRSVRENVLPSRAAGCGAGGSPQKSLLQFAMETVTNRRAKEIVQGGFS
jgi:hypothetical protein